MSVYGYSISKGKTRFNIYVSSRQINSFTGTIYDATYTIDLRGHIDVTDFQKEYNVTLAFDSEASSDDINDINPDKTYAIHLDLGGNKINTHGFREIKTPHFIAFKDSFTASSSLFTRFKIANTDNASIRVQSLYNLDKIGFNLFDIDGQATLTSTTLDYQFVLSFEEV
jgi:hypothetical protein